MFSSSFDNSKVDGLLMFLVREFVYWITPDFLRTFGFRV